MASTTFKRSVYRILSDLVKTDDVISVGEMDTLDEAVKALGLTDDDRKDSYSLSWADAAACVAAQKPRLKEKVIRNKALRGRILDELKEQVPGLVGEVRTGIANKLREYLPPERIEIQYGRARVVLNGFEDDLKD